MRHLRSSKQPGATIVLEENETEANFLESADRAETKQPVEGSDEHNGETNRKKSRRNRKKKKQANLRKCIESEDGGLDTSDSPANIHIESSYIAASSALSQISLNQMTDPKGLSISKKILPKPKMNATDDEHDCQQDTVNNAGSGRRDIEKFPCPDGSSIEAPELKTIHSKTQAVVWSNPAFGSDTPSEQKSCNTVSTSSPDLADSVSYCSNLNTSEVRTIANDARFEIPLRQDLLEKKLEEKNCGAIGNEGSPALRSNICDSTQTYEVEKFKLKGGKDEEGEHLENNCNKETEIQKSFHVPDFKPISGRISVLSSLKSNAENGKAKAESTFTSYDAQTRIGLRRIEATFQTMDSKYIENEVENEKQNALVEPAHISEDLGNLSSQHRTGKNPLIGKIKADRQDELDRELEEEIEREIAILTKRLADIHARRETRKTSQDHVSNAMSCPGTPILTAKLLPPREAAGVKEQNTFERDKMRTCKGRVVSAKFLECHSKQEVRKTPTSIDRKLNLRETLIPGSSKTKPQRRGASLGGFGVFSKADYVDSSVKISANNPVHFSRASDKEIQVEKMNSTNKELQGEAQIKSKTPKQETDVSGFSTKRLTGSSFRNDEICLTGNICTRKTDFVKSLTSEISTVLTHIEQERVAENILTSKTTTPEVRRSKIIPKSMAKIHLKTENVNGSEKPTTEIFEPQLLATLKESRAFRRSPITKTQLQNNELKEAATEFPEAHLLATLRENRAFRRSPVTGKVKCVPSRYGESPRQSTPPLRSKPSDQAEKHSLSPGGDGPTSVYGGDDAQGSQSSSQTIPLSSTSVDCPFNSLHTCRGKGMKPGSFANHLRSIHFSNATKASEVKHALEYFDVFDKLNAALRVSKRWLCGGCLESMPWSKKSCSHKDGSTVTLGHSARAVPACLIINMPPPSKSALPFSQQPVRTSRQRVEPPAPPVDIFTLSVELLDVVFKAGIPTVKSIPLLCRLPFADALRAALNHVVASPRSIEAWVRLLLLPTCVLYRFTPESAQERTARKRNSLQQLMILRALETWNSGPGGIQQLLARILNHKPLPPRPHAQEAYVERARSKVKDGQYAAAIRMLSSSGVAPAGVETRQSLEEKHPQRDLPVANRVSEIDAAPLEVDAPAVEEAIKSFPKGTACGRDGLRAQHLLDALRGAAAAIKGEVIVAVTSVVNLWLAGLCPSSLAQFVASAPLTPLLKPDGGIRPIAVGTIWRRLVSKLAMMRVSKDMSMYLKDYQFGVGIPGGAEAILHAVNRLVEAEKNNNTLTMALVDFSNAFNLVDRSVLFKEVRRKCPTIARWVEFTYGSAAKLYVGHDHLLSSTGVQQGDPLGPLLFSLVLHPLIHRLKEECNLDFMAFYLDDGTILDDTEKVAHAIHLIKEVGPDYGLELNISKTEIFWPCDDPRRSAPDLFPSNIARPSRGVKVLGGPVSTDVAFCVNLLKK